MTKAKIELWQIVFSNGLAQRLHLQVQIKGLVSMLGLILTLLHSDEFNWLKPQVAFAKFMKPKCVHIELECWGAGHGAG